MKKKMTGNRGSWAKKVSANPTDPTPITARCPALVLFCGLLPRPSCPQVICSSSPSSFIVSSHLQHFHPVGLHFNSNYCEKQQADQSTLLSSGKTRVSKCRYCGCCQAVRNFFSVLLFCNLLWFAQMCHIYIFRLRSLFDLSQPMFVAFLCCTIHRPTSIIYALLLTLSILSPLKTPVPVRSAHSSAKSSSMGSKTHFIHSNRHL